MKRFAFAAFILLACAAGFAGSLIHDSLKTADPTEAVHAAPERAKAGAVRIAVINLEQASRESRKFKELKILWEAAQEELKKQNQKMEKDYNAKLAELRRAGTEDEKMALRVELKSFQEAQKVSQDEQQKYLGALLAQYQTEVLRHVMEEMDKFVRKEGYDIVLQDYDVEAADADFFSGGAYAQSLMSKPVLLTPGTKDKKNAYVVDITQEIINLVKGP